MSLETTIHNERTKLLATTINTVATGCFALGVIGPLAAVVFDLGGTAATAKPLNLLFGVWDFLLTGAALHLTARSILGVLKE